mgnify:CR=1 FL=1|jgi:hypothetical protein
MKKESYNEYYSLRCTVQEIISKSESTIEQKITTIASGLLGISVAILPFQEDIPLSLMSVGWIFLCSSIIGNLVSILVAKRQATKTLDAIDDLIQKDKEYEHKTMYDLVCRRNKYTDRWNIISVILLYFGIVFTLLSVLLNN